MSSTRSSGIYISTSTIMSQKVICPFPSRLFLRFSFLFFLSELFIFVSFSYSIFSKTAISPYSSILLSEINVFNAVSNPRGTAIFIAPLSCFLNVMRLANSLKISYSDVLFEIYTSIITL